MHKVGDLAVVGTVRGDERAKAESNDGGNDETGQLDTVAS